MEKEGRGGTREGEGRGLEKKGRETDQCNVHEIYVVYHSYRTVECFSYIPLGCIIRKSITLKIKKKLTYCARWYLEVEEELTDIGRTWKGKLPT